MLIAAKDLYQRMQTRWQEGGPKKIELHPTGPAIVTKVVQLLDEALGKNNWIAEARKFTEQRRKKELEDLQSLRSKVFAALGVPKEQKSTKLLDPSVHKEHFQYLSALVGRTGIN